jgi:hypothetical protein
MKKVKELFDLGVPSTFYKLNNSREFICGCEFEIEDIKAILEDLELFNCIEDHSLRNNGREFTTPPLLFDEQCAAFTILHSSLELGADPFSDRTSIHVHVNVRELTEQEVRQFILLYALLEPLFFEFVGDVRKGSIFCVPLNHTYLPSLYKHPLAVLQTKWHKYTAFNILPLSTFGTIEFRHMYGTGNKPEFIHWLTCLKELYTFIESTPDFSLLDELSKGTSVVTIARAAVPTLCIPVKEEDLLSMLEDTTTDVKLSAGGIK